MVSQSPFATCASFRHLRSQASTSLQASSPTIELFEYSFPGVSCVGLPGSPCCAAIFFERRRRFKPTGESRRAALHTRAGPDSMAGLVGLGWPRKAKNNRFGTFIWNARWAGRLWGGSSDAVDHRRRNMISRPPLEGRRWICPARQAGGATTSMMHQSLPTHA